MPTWEMPSVLLHYPIFRWLPPGQFTNPFAYKYIPLFFENSKSKVIVVRQATLTAFRVAFYCMYAASLAAITSLLAWHSVQLTGPNLKKGQALILDYSTSPLDHPRQFGLQGV
jgi:hypothetical protein